MIPPIVLLGLPKLTPTTLPRLAPFGLVPMRFPRILLPVAAAFEVSIPATLLNPKTLAAPDVIPPIVLLRAADAHADRVAQVCVGRVCADQVSEHDVAGGLGTIDRDSCDASEAEDIR